MTDIFFDHTEIRQFVLVHPTLVPPGEICAITGMGFPEAFTSPGFPDGNKAVWQLTVPATEIDDGVFTIDEEDLSVIADGDIDLVVVYFYVWAYYEDFIPNILEAVQDKKRKVIHALALASLLPPSKQIN